MLIQSESMLIHANPLLAPPVLLVPRLFPLKNYENQWTSMKINEKMIINEHNVLIHVNPLLGPPAPLVAGLFPLMNTTC
jgi:hypothetical protein